METKEPDKFTAVDRSKKYTFEDFKPYIKTLTDWDNRKLLLLPNIEAKLLSTESFKETLNRIAHNPYKFVHGQIRYGTAEFECAYGTAWFDTLQGDGLSGSGIAVIPMYGSNQMPWCASFAICKHETKYMPTARPQRGLHDKFCVRCGLDMSVDSSD